MSRAQTFVVVQFGLLAALGISLMATPSEPAPIVRMLGQALIVGATIVLVLAVLAYRTTNRSLPNVTPTPNAHAALVTSGVYSVIRHPIYTAVLLASVGVALTHGHALPLVLAAVMVGFFTLKARYEEQLLSAVYPEYKAYMARTGRFLPFL
jgi:protein-S-isoprenylcysteine O-methyltransferase Ste14